MGNLYLFTQGYSGELFYKKLIESGIHPTVYTYAADATRKSGDKAYLREGFPLRYIHERSYDPQRIELRKEDLVICFDWTKDFFHSISAPCPVYHLPPLPAPPFPGLRSGK